LESEVLLIGDVGPVRQLNVAHGHCREGCSPEVAGSVASARDFRRRFAFHIDIKERRLLWLKLEVPRDEAIAVRIDEVARDVLSKRHSWRTRQDEVAAARLPARQLCHRPNGSTLESVARQEPFCSEHAVRLDIVVAFGIAPAPCILPLHAPD
jgi:hypothetical protein